MTLVEYWFVFFCVIATPIIANAAIRSEDSFSVIHRLSDLMRVRTFSRSISFRVGHGVVLVAAILSGPLCIPRR